jgi:hypothetical protein
MEWLFNFHLMEASGFEHDARELILRVFDNASNALDEEQNKFIQAFEKELAKAPSIDESERGMLYQEMDWEERLYQQRRQGVGALALDWLMCSLQGALHSAKTHLDSSHPPRRRKYKGRSWLNQVTAEYRQRFKIDFEKQPAFVRIQELVLARNAAIHRESKGNLDEYVAKIKNAAFVDYGDAGEYFFVTRAALVAMIDDCEQFIKWVVSEIEKLRPVKKTSGVL